MDASVIIVSHDCRNVLRACLTSLYHHTRGVEWEVLVVDNASRDGTPEMVAAEFPPVRLLRRKDNPGFSAACNQGMREAQGEHLLLLNPDTELRENLLPPLIEYCRGHPEVGVIAPRLVNPDGNLQMSCRRYPTRLTALFNRTSLLTRLLPDNPFSARYLMSDWDHASIADVEWLSGACMLLTRRAFRVLGGFDERFSLSFEDVDLCRRAHGAGLRVVYYPFVTVMHHIGRGGAGGSLRVIVLRHRSMWRYHRKYLGGNPLLDAATLAGVVARCGAQVGVSSAQRLLAAARRL